MEHDVSSAAPGVGTVESNTAAPPGRRPFPTGLMGFGATAVSTPSGEADTMSGDTSSQSTDSSEPEDLGPFLANTTSRTGRRRPRSTRLGTRHKRPVSPSATRPAPLNPRNPTLSPDVPTRLDSAGPSQATAPAPAPQLIPPADCRDTLTHILFHCVHPSFIALRHTMFATLTAIVAGVIPQGVPSPPDDAAIRAFLVHDFASAHSVCGQVPADLKTFLEAANCTEFDLNAAGRKFQPALVGGLRKMWLARSTILRTVKLDHKTRLALYRQNSRTDATVGSIPHGHTPLEVNPFTEGDVPGGVASGGT